jgi:hypothetical protein
VKDIVLVAGVVLAFAILVTTHVTIAFGLLRRHPRWRAPVAFVVAPLAPYWAWRDRMRVRATLWSAALVLYVVAMLLARRA